MQKKIIMVVGVMGVLFVAGLFIWNNAREEENDSLVITEDTAITEGASDSISSQQEDEIDELSVSSQKPSNSYRYAFLTRKIICPLREEPLLYVLVQLDLLYNETALKEELIFKKDDVEAVIQNLIYTSGKVDIKVTVLRGKITQVLNTFLQKGKIEDIVFKDFKIEIRNSDNK
ncbi:MAG: hypothetical protein HQK83_15705 [Fibrobacteria bacterium]|nr:hypothetical protein [Fibrobacteria bacterium]